jgi:hypothetical protein
MRSYMLFINAYNLYCSLLYVSINVLVLLTYFIKKNPISRHRVCFINMQIKPCTSKLTISILYSLHLDHALQIFLILNKHKMTC